MSSNGSVWKMPALLTTASSRPNASTAWSTIACPPSGVSTGLVVGDRLASGRLDLGDDGVGDRRVLAGAGHRPADVVDHHGRAAPRQVERVQTAEAAPGSGYHHGLAVEVDHAMRFPS